MIHTSTYEALRQWADSWGLVLSGMFFLGLILWPFRPGAKHFTDSAARSIFDEDEIDD